MNDHVSEHWPGRGPSPLEQALSDKLDLLVASGRLTEAGAGQILPGYQYPELLVWIHDPLDQVQVPDLDAVLVLGEQYRTQQARQAAAAAQERYWTTRTDQHADTHVFYDATTHTAEATHAADDVDDADDADVDGV